MAYFRCTGNSGGSLKLRTAQGGIASFETNLPEPYPSVTVNVVATGGNGTPDNPIPINGYSSANITRCGVNLWDEEWEIGGINGNTGANGTSTNQIRSVNYIPVRPNTSYFFKLGSLQGTGNIFQYDRNKNYLGLSTLLSNSGGTVVTLEPDTYFIRISSGTTYGTTYNNDISINYPATDTIYHAYNGQTYAIAFGQTVYGGVLNVTRGKLTVTHKLVNLTDMTWLMFGAGDFFYSTSVDVKGSSNSCSMSCYKNSGDDDYFTITVTSIIRIYDSSYTDLASFVASLTGQTFKYELAMPFDIDLTPVQIRALVGENNVFADCGETEVEYLKVE